MNNILVPYNFGHQASLALDWALQLAAIMRYNITLLYVNEIQNIFGTLFNQEKKEEILEKISEMLDSTAAKLSLKSGVNVDARLQQGRIFHEIIAVAEELQSEFIVMGTRNEILSENNHRQMIGRNTSRVIRLSACPVITIGGDKLPVSWHSVLLPLDLTRITRQKTAWAIMMAKITGADIKIVSVSLKNYNKEEQSKLQDQLKEVAQLIENAGISCTSEIIETSGPEHEIVPKILEYAGKNEDIGLIVIMTQQESAIIDFFIGSQAQEIIRNSIVPVMSVIPDSIDNEAANHETKG